MSESHQGASVEGVTVESNLFEGMTFRVSPILLSCSTRCPDSFCSTSVVLPEATSKPKYPKEELEKEYALSVLDVPGCPDKRSAGFMHTAGISARFYREPTRLLLFTVGRTRVGVQFQIDALLIYTRLLLTAPQVSHAIRKELDVVRPLWIMDCITKGTILKYRKKCSSPSSCFAYRY